MPKPPRTIPKPDAVVAEVFESWPAAIRLKALALRKLILETTANTDGVGPLTETLKWGEPAYLTEQTRSCTTIRIGWKKSDPQRYAMYFNCQTNLVETFRTLFPDELAFEGNRAIVFEGSQAVPRNALAICIEAALTYHRSKRSGSRSQAAR